MKITNNRPGKPNAEAILIKPLGGSFADVLGQIKSKVKPEQTETVTKSIRCTQNRNVLLELGKSKDKAGFAKALKTALGDKESIQSLESRSSVEIRDLGGLTTDVEVIEAIKTAIPEIMGEAEKLKVWLMKLTKSQQQMVVAEIDKKHTNKLLSVRHLKA